MRVVRFESDHCFESDLFYESQIKMAAPLHISTHECKDSMASVKAVSSAAPLALRIVAECPVSKARACTLTLPHCAVNTPVFMPVGTQGTLKGITVDQLEDLDCQICLGNTYHLGMRPVCERKYFRLFDCFIRSTMFKTVIVCVQTGS